MIEAGTRVKSISMSREMIDAIQLEAKCEHRSFSRQVVFFLERELTHGETRIRGRRDAGECETTEVGS